jgi:hypothetical protein
MSSAHCAITATGGGSTLSAAAFRVFRRRAWFNLCGAWKKSGLVARTVLTTGRLGVEYAFTDLGRTLQRPVAALFEWTTEYAAVLRAAQAAFEVTTADERDAA